MIDIFIYTIPRETVRRHDCGQPPHPGGVLVRKKRWSEWLADAPSGGLIGIGTFCYRRGYFSFAAVIYTALQLILFGNPKLQRLLVQCEIRQKKFDRAFARFLRLSNLASPPDLAMKNETIPRPFVSDRTYKTVCVTTSIMPKRIEAQRAALNSWRAAGLSVVSINSAPEAAQLRDHFPDVSFQLIDKPAVDARGRPLVPIHAMMQAARDASSDICGIINSDIEFRGQPSFFDLVRQQVAGSLIFGNRVDVVDRKVRRGKTYRNGYDFFFWDRKNSPLLEKSPMVLGLPWWDFWLPLHAYAQGLRIKRFASSSFIHVVHPVGYDAATFVRFGHYCTGALADAYSRWREGQVPPDRLFLHRLFSTAMAIPLGSDPQTDPFEMGAVCHLANCMIDTVCETIVLPDARLASGMFHFL
jgi:hypothetical protein